MNAELISKVLQQDEASVRELLKSGANPNCRDSDGSTPLLKAVLRKNANLVSMLLDYGADVNGAANNGADTPLKSAVTKRFVDGVRILLKAGASVNSTDLCRHTALHHATHQHSVDLVDILLAHGASPDIPNLWNSTPLLYAASFFNGVFIKTILTNDCKTDGHLAHSMALDDPQYSGLTTIFSALLKHSSRPDLRDGKGNTPLHRAAGDGYQKAVCRLLTVTAEWDSPNLEGQTPLHMAAKGGHSAIIRRLLEHGFQPDTRDNWGDTPLHFAVRSHHLEAVQEILGATSEPDAINNFGSTALHLAAYQGLVEIAETLLINGADLNLRSPVCGSTALHLAPHRQHSDCIDLLLANGARMNVKDICGRTPLAIAKEEKYATVIDQLANPLPCRLQPQSLQRSCRGAIRSRLIASQPQQLISASINKLDCLPPCIRHYLYAALTPGNSKI